MSAIITEMAGEKSPLRKQVSQHRGERICDIQGIDVSGLGSLKAKELTPLQLLNMLVKTLRVIAKN